MAHDPDKDELDLAALLESVHGKSDLESRQDQLDAAVRAIETTHRQASLAIRHFERTGRTSAEAEVADVIAALGALANEPAVPPSQAAAGGQGAHTAPAGEATQVTAQGVQGEATTVGYRAEGTTRTGPNGASTEATAIFAGPATNARGNGVGGTAARPQGTPPAAGRGTPAEAADLGAAGAPEATAIFRPATAQSPPSQAGIDAGSAARQGGLRPKALAADEPTQTFAIAPAATGEAAAPAGLAGPRSGTNDQAPAAQVSPARGVKSPRAPVTPAQVVSGRGKDFGSAEVTRTKIIKRSKR